MEDLKVMESYLESRRRLIYNNKKLIRLLLKNKVEHIYSGRETTGWFNEWYYYWDFKVSKKIYNLLLIDKRFPNRIEEYDDFYIISLLVKEDGI